MMGNFVKSCLSARRILSAMIFWGQIQNYMMRVSLGILIVAMVKDPALEKKPGDPEAAVLNLTCMENRGNLSALTSAALDKAKEGRHEGFDWDELTRGKILGIFSFGYLCTQVS